MCYSCYEEYGKPAIVTDEIRQAAKLIEKVYDFSGVGGHLHIVLDDWNISDDSLDFCDRHIDAEGYDCPQGQIEAELACLNAFRKLSISHRAAALALHEGFLKP